MNALYTASRILVAFLGFTTLLGVLWFAGSLEGFVVAASVLLGFSSLAAAFVPLRKLSRGVVRHILLALCATAIAAGIVLLADNFGTSQKIEWHVVSINLLHVGAIAVMALRALKARASTPDLSSS